MVSSLRRVRLLAGAAGVLLSVSAAGASGKIDFVHEVVPVLKQHCAECHGGGEAKGGFSINTRESFLDDDVAKPGDAGESYFLKLVASADPDDRMPPEDKPRVPGESVKLLRAWVNAGMPWEPGFTFAEPAYEPPLKPRRPKLPEAVDGRTNPVDRILDAWLAGRDLPRPKPVDDRTFMRRASLDLTGLLPEPGELEEFVADSRPDKRPRAIRRLLDDDIAYADHWLTFWNDLLRNDYTGTGFITGGRQQISSWLYEALLTNKPFDRFVQELIAPPTPASSGYIDGIRWRGEVSAGQSVEIQFAQSVSQTFLGINMKCASCHDSFIDRWKLDEAYGLAAIYSKRPLEIHRCDKPVGRKAAAAWLFPELGQVEPEAPQPERLQQMAALMTHPENGRVTRTVVNRLWAQLMGRGIVHPLDAMQTKPWNADLLDYLAVYLSDHDYDLKSVLELIATSEAYRSRSEVIEDPDEGGGYVYAGSRARRMTAEQFVDAVWQLTGAAPTTHDAPVFRGRVDDEAVQALDLQGHWIWGASAGEGKIPPAGEEIMLRKVLKLDDELQQGGAVVTCDNEFVLFLNGREVIRGDNWTEPQAVALNGRLKKGGNQIVVRAKNAGSSPNPAGLYFEARLQLKNGTDLVVASGGDWQWNPKLPASREGRLGRVPGEWEPVVVVKTLDAWSQSVSGRTKSLLAVAADGEMPMVRASLMKSDFLMRSLGRPMREQIVSSRPSEISTLEAIDLYNNEALTDYLARGAERLAGKDWEDKDALTRYIFQYALSRPPTREELEAVRESLGGTISPAGVQDLLWAVCMTPEFMVVR